MNTKSPPPSKCAKLPAGISNVERERALKLLRDPNPRCIFNISDYTWDAFTFFWDRRLKLLCSCQKILLGGKQTLSLFSPQQGSINLVDLEKCCKMDICSQKSAWIQPRTSPPKLAEASKHHPPPVINAALRQQQFRLVRVTRLRTPGKQRSRDVYH